MEDWKTSVPERQRYEAMAMDKLRFGDSVFLAEFVYGHDDEILADSRNRRVSTVVHVIAVMHVIAHPPENLTLQKICA
jgi:hypothetical protein